MNERSRGKYGLGATCSHRSPICWSRAAAWAPRASLSTGSVRHSPVDHMRYSESTQQHGPSRAASTRVKAVAAGRRYNSVGDNGRVSIPQTTNKGPMHCWGHMVPQIRDPAAAVGSNCCHCAASPAMFPCCCFHAAVLSVVIRRGGCHSDARGDNPWEGCARGHSMRCCWSVGMDPWEDHESGGIQRCGAQHFGVSPPWLVPGQQHRRPINLLAQVGNSTTIFDFFFFVSHMTYRHVRIRHAVITHIVNRRVRSWLHNVR